MANKLTNMTKAGAIISVDETCVEAHERQGWTVTEQEKPVADVVEDAAPEPTDEEKQALKDARADYKDLTGKKAGPAWSVEDIAEKMAAFTAENPPAPTD